MANFAVPRQLACQPREVSCEMETPPSTNTWQSAVAWWNTWYYMMHNMQCDLPESLGDVWIRLVLCCSTCNTAALEGILPLNTGCPQPPVWQSSSFISNKNNFPNYKIRILQKWSFNPTQPRILGCSSNVINLTSSGRRVSWGSQSLDRIIKSAGTHHLLTLVTTFSHFIDEELGQGHNEPKVPQSRSRPDPTPDPWAWESPLCTRGLPAFCGRPRAGIF